MSSAERYFDHENDPQLRDLIQRQGKPEPYNELVASLARIIRQCPPDRVPADSGWNLQGLYYGPTATAYLFLELSQLYPDLRLLGKSLHEWCLAYLLPTIQSTHKSGKVDPSHCGIAQETLVSTCILAVAKHDASLARKLCSYKEVILSNSEQESNEWLYGRAGYLYLLRRTKAGFAGDTNTLGIIQNTIEDVASCILKASQPWTWHGKPYIGAAHGAFGVLVQLVLSSPTYASHCQDILLSLLDTQLPSGNFPSSFSRLKEDVLVQFCHGSPGASLSLMSLRPFYPELQVKIDAALEKSRANTWRRGLLTKRPCLCHGISGNALALALDKPRFEYFLSFTTKAMIKEIWGKKALGKAGTDEACSLYTGEAGRAWAWAMADKGVHSVCIGYNDL
jgi:hypothetical protein